MKNTKTNSRTTFSWLGYGALSLSMLVIAAVSATVGQDKDQSATIKMGGGAATTGQAFGSGGMGMGMFAMEIEAPTFVGDPAKDRIAADSYLDRRIISTLHPERMSRAMRVPEFQYATVLHVEDGKPLEKLVRFEVTRTKSNEGRMPRSKKTVSSTTVVGTGILQIDSGEIYMETPGDQGLLTLQRLNRDHFATMHFQEDTPQHLADSRGK